jgi:uncharacterized membrane protein YfcA
MDQHTLLLAAVPVTGFVAGFINTLAGSGSLLSLPILILLGLPANVANATNRVGVTMQNIVAVATFRSHGALPLAGSWKLIALARRGAAVLRDRRLRRLPPSQRRVVPLAALVLAAGYELVGANAMKNLIVLVFTVAALVVFVVHDQVEWMLGLLLGAGQAVGAWVAAHFAVKRGAEFVRWAVVVISIGSAVALFAGL